MKMPAVYLSLGTNLGDRRANLRSAVAALPPRFNVLSESRLYETPPWGYEDQPAFFNMAVGGETNLDPAAVLKFLKELEARLGRAPSFRWGPRLIDIDILFYGDLILNTPSLVIPHPRLHERAFVLVPLAEIAPDLLHPVLGRSVMEMCAAVDISGIRPLKTP